jgi:hypothetical protein
LAKEGVTVEQIKKGEISEDDLKEINIPLGPRKSLMKASQSHQ